jgi:hypothetical protein
LVVGRLSATEGNPASAAATRDLDERSDIDLVW